jgi:hypothetical protein
MLANAKIGPRIQIPSSKSPFGDLMCWGSINLNTILKFVESLFRVGHACHRIRNVFVIINITTTATVSIILCLQTGTELGIWIIVFWIERSASWPEGTSNVGVSLSTASACVNHGPLLTNRQLIASRNSFLFCKLTRLKIREQIQQTLCWLFREIWI